VIRIHAFLVKVLHAASVCLALAPLLVVAPAIAQKDAAYPSRVVTLVNPFSPGASTDIVARLIAQKLTESWGQNVVVENRPGASGMIGLASVARAPADGHVLAMIIITHATTAALLGNKSGIDLVRDFSPVTQVVSQPYSLVVNASLPVRSVKELVALARTQPGALTYGSSGVGSVLHLAGELLAAQSKVKLTHVPYKGASLALSDVAGGHLAMLFTTRMSAQAMVAAKRVRMLAVTSAERVRGAPDLPTVQESGVTGPFEVNGWYGIGAPAGTPTAIVERLNQEVGRILKMPEVYERMTTEGTQPVSGTPAQFGELVRSEVEKWRRIIQQAGIAPGAF
jgi:tripartite-type tricarboxylate transporter receptor subunit TctC